MKRNSMKASFTLLFFITILTFSCSKPNEIGANSIVFYLNGNKTLPLCNDTGVKLLLNQNNFELKICFDDEATINYHIKNYQGVGIYYFDNATDNKCHIENRSYNLSADQVFNSVNNHQTYLYILELDKQKGIIRGLFESTLITQTNPSDTLKITKGRFDYYYQ